MLLLIMSLPALEPPRPVIASSIAMMAMVTAARFLKRSSASGDIRSPVSLASIEALRRRGRRLV